MGRIRRTMWWMGTGAALAYLFDPDKGPRRRAHAKETIDDLVGKVKGAPMAFDASSPNGGVGSQTPHQTAWTPEGPRTTVGPISSPGST